MSKQRNASFLIIFAVLAFVFLIAFVRFLKKPEELNILDTFYGEKPTLEIFNTDPVRGPADARVTIVEFGDFSCEHCKESAPIIRQILRDYPNEVRVVWKDLPAATYPQNSGPLHVAGQCAHRQGRFWEYHDQLFAAQNTALTRNDLVAMAVDAGLDRLAFEDCVDNNETIPLILERNLLMAQELGVDGVPYFVLNDTKHLSGTLSLERWRKEIDSMLK